MNEVLLIYLWLKLDDLCGLMVLLSVAAGISVIGMFVAWGVRNDSVFHPNTNIKFNQHFPRWFFPAVLSLWMVTALIPSSKQMAYMVGAHYAVKLADTPEASKVMTLIRKKANDLLDEQLKEKK